MLAEKKYGIHDGPVMDTESGSPVGEKNAGYYDDTGAVSGESFAYGDSTAAKIQRFAGRFNIEQRGIERVPESERTDSNLYKIGTMVGQAVSSRRLHMDLDADRYRGQWLAANMVVSSFAIGALAVPIFYLGFVDALLTIFFINILGIFPVCFFSTFGSRFGLRQMVLSRYFYGYYGVKLSQSTYNTSAIPCPEPQQLTFPSRLLQRPRLRRMVFRQRHRRRPDPQRHQQRRPRLGRHHHHRGRDLLRDAVRVQSRARVRVLELDPVLHRLPDRARRVRALGPVLQHPHGRRRVRSRRRALLRRLRLRLRHGLDLVRGRLHRLPADPLLQDESLPLDLRRAHLPAVLHRDARPRGRNSLGQQPDRGRGLQHQHRRPARVRARAAGPLRAILPRHPRAQHHRQQLPEHLQRDLLLTGHEPLDGRRPALHLDLHRHPRLLRHRHPGLLALRVRARGFHAPHRTCLSLTPPPFPPFQTLNIRSHD